MIDVPLTPDRSDDDAWRIAFVRRVEAGAFAFARQPIVDMASGRPAHEEVFVRFEGAASPADIIARAETLSVIQRLDVAVVQAAARHLKHATLTGAGLSINLSAQTLTDAVAMDTICDCVRLALFNPALLAFEVTESAEIVDLALANARIQRLRGLGCSVSLDDFGAGYASLSYLQSLDVDCVKIDGRYVRSVNASARDARLLQAIIQMCAALDVSTVAEMIETDEHAALAQRFGVRFGQGYHFGRPRPADDLTPIRKQEDYAA